MRSLRRSKTACLLLDECNGSCIAQAGGAGGTGHVVAIGGATVTYERVLRRIGALAKPPNEEVSETLWVQTIPKGGSWGRFCMLQKRKKP